MSKSQIRAWCKENLRRLRKQSPAGSLPSFPVPELTSFLPSRPTQILVYLATRWEPSSQELIMYLWEDTYHEVFIPNTSDLSPAFTHFTPETQLSKSQIGTFEDLTQEKIFRAGDFRSKSVCIVPCLGVSHENFRLGYGSGFYDRFLAEFPGKSIGVVYQKNIVDFTPEDHDIPLDTIISW
mgnify:CR=1 FL=1